jgi:hypothetical protein
MCLLCSIAAPTFIALYLTANTARGSLQAPSHLPQALAHLTPIIYQSTFFFSHAFVSHFLLLVFVAPEELTLPRDFFLIHVLHWPMGCAIPKAACFWILVEGHSASRLCAAVCSFGSDGQDARK